MTWAVKRRRRFAADRIGRHQDAARVNDFGRLPVKFLARA